MNQVIRAALLVAFAICLTGCTASQPITLEVLASKNAQVLRKDATPQFKLFWGTHFEDALLREFMKLGDVELIATPEGDKSDATIQVLITGSVMNNAYQQLNGYKVTTGVTSKKPSRSEEYKAIVKKGEAELNKWAAETAAKIEAQFIEPLR